MLLGDRIHSALETIGITEDVVTNWIGAPCQCQERIEKLNQLDCWARRVASGKFKDAKRFFQEMVQP